ncbi:peroxidase family protein [Rhodobacter sp. SY28-1]|uniref:peroxidase family protein n=1 Tax=Rhodobacter sp. SY28-1 TaxID=2562317 RepID=UPI0010C03D9B|nr:peroxidase family protein [Rhodobacter sp. SY28-1]
MPPITSPHSLFGADPTAAPLAESAGESQSGYCFLYPDLAQREDVGCFTGRPAALSFKHLQAFEAASRGPLSAPQVLPMRLPAVYTYFGQFVNHDISAPVGDVVTPASPPEGVGVITDTSPPGLDRSDRAAPEVILGSFLNEQANPLALDSLYGDGGPDSTDPDIRALYAPDRKRFRLGLTRVEDPQVFVNKRKNPARVIHATGAPDILRKDGKPLIADHRNDENLIISQLHLALMLFHNKAVAALEPKFPDAAKCFAEARHLVTLHYHWLILNDFLPKLLSPKALQTPLAQRPQKLPAARTVPLEFTTAAFRFGHSMVGAAYDFNANFGRGGRVERDGASLIELFTFTTHRNMGHPDKPTLQLPDHWVIDWERITRAPRPTPGPGGAERIDLTFAPDMLNVMGSSDIAVHGSILFRNLMRGFQRRIAFGQELAKACGLDAMKPEEVRAALPDVNPARPGEKSLREIAEQMDMLTQTPAWLYFLCEARHFEQGERLGPVASDIIADTFVGLLRHMPQSILNHAGGSWHPRKSPLRSAGGRSLTSIRALLKCAVAK